MNESARGHHGYSMTELLIVLVIVAVLALVGVSMVGYRTEESLRTVMDEIEGTLASAHQFAAASGQDVLVATQGEWSATNPLILAYGSAGTAAVPVTPAAIITQNQNSAQAFRVGVVGSGLVREHLHAEVVTGTRAGDWGTATAGSTAITSVPPFNDSSTGFQGILGTAASNLFQGGSTPASVRISGTNKRFATTFWVEVVAMRGGSPVPGGPVGLLVGLANGSTIYKFYNPGTHDGSQGTWRRI